MEVPGASEPLKHNCLSCGIVAVWASSMREMPAPPSQFLKELFGDPHTTTLLIGPDGLTVKRLMKPPQPFASLGPARLEVLTAAPEETARVVGALAAEVRKAANQKEILLSGLGLNVEHEWIEPGWKPSSEWLARHFALSDRGANATEVQSIHIRIVLDEQRPLFVNLQPRAENPEGVWAATNDHRELMAKPLPEGEDLVRMLTESIRLTEERIGAILGGQR
jgi:hypothetical protein